MGKSEQSNTPEAGLRFATNFRAGPDGVPFVIESGLPELSEQSMKNILEYLRTAPVLLTLATPEKDLISNAERRAPSGYQTDGMWIWPLSMAYYMELYGILPPDDFVMHMVAVSFTLPKELSEDTRASAMLALGFGRTKISEEDAIETVQDYLERVSPDVEVPELKAIRFSSGWTVAPEADDMTLSGERFLVGDNRIIQVAQPFDFNAEDLFARRHGDKPAKELLPGDWGYPQEAVRDYVDANKLNYPVAELSAEVARYGDEPGEHAYYVRASNRTLDLVEHLNCRNIKFLITEEGSVQEVPDEYLLKTRGKYPPPETFEEPSHPLDDMKRLDD